jgi:hypothetical protein
MKTTYCLHEYLFWSTRDESRAEFYFKASLS